MNRTELVLVWRAVDCYWPPTALFRRSSGAAAAALLPAAGPLVARCEHTGGYSAVGAALRILSLSIIYTLSIITLSIIFTLRISIILGILFTLSISTLSILPSSASSALAASALAASAELKHSGSLTRCRQGHTKSLRGRTQRANEGAAATRLRLRLPWALRSGAARLAGR